jgi:tetratricopeptide (TPR) repeat protein
VEALETLTAERLAEQVDRLAHHAVRGAVWDKALTYSRQAGAKAMARSAYREAAECLEQALAALAQLPERRDTVEQAIDLRLDLCSALVPLSEHARVFEHLHAAEALAERLDDPQRLGRLASYLCFSFWVIGEHDRAIASGQRALALAIARGIFNVQVIARNSLGIAYYAAGDYAQGLDCMRQEIALLPGDLGLERFGFPILPAAISRGYVAWGLAELGDFVEAASMGEDAVRLAEAATHHASIAGALWLAGLVSRRQGDVRAAIPRLEQSLALSQTANILSFPVIASLLSAAYALAGRTVEALPLLDQMLERVATGNPHVLPCPRTR